MSIFNLPHPQRKAKGRPKPSAMGVPSRYAASGPEEFAEELDAINVVPLDEAPEFHPRPAMAGTTYPEQMGELRAEEQLKHYRGLGENLARPYRETADEHQEAADHERHLIEQHRPVVEKALAKYHTLLDVVGDAYVRRHPRERHWYHIRMVFLLLGDLVGVAGGAIILGEIPWLAVLQAMAAAVAAITSGLLASEIKDSRLARKRKRDPNSLPDEHKSHAHIFQGPDAGECLVKLMVYGSLTIIVLLGIGIFMLRSTTEGADAGVVFGMIAIAVAMGSWVNTYHYTDELADHVEQAEEHAHRTTEHHRNLMAMPARAIVAKALATAKSIEKEYEELAQAAYRRVLATVIAFQASRPAIYGHGWAPGQSPAPPASAGETRQAQPETVDLRTIAPPISSNGHHPLAEEAS
jgi:hypothetical protein